jgi:hypothetical protein
MDHLSRKQEVPAMTRIGIVGIGFMGIKPSPEQIRFHFMPHFTGSS